MELKVKEVKAIGLNNETIKEVFGSLMYGSYKSNRDEGMTHEQLRSIGIGNDKMKAVYEMQKEQGHN